MSLFCRKALIFPLTWLPRDCPTEAYFFSPDIASLMATILFIAYSTIMMSATPMTNMNAFVWMSPYVNISIYVFKAPCGYH